MLHSNIKVKYPTRPFIIDRQNIQNVYDYDVQVINKDYIFSNINDIRLVRFITELIDNDEYDDIEYIKITQNIPKNTNNYMINFHTTIYEKMYNNFINRELNEVVAWKIIPLTDNIKTKNIKIAIKDKKPEIKDNSINFSNFNPQKYTRNIDGDKDKLYYKVKQIRTSNRNFIKRNIVIKTEKKDTFDNINVIAKTKIKKNKNISRIIDNNNYDDFIYSNLNISKKYNIWSFNNDNNNDFNIFLNNDNDISFLSILIHNTTLYISLHNIVKY